MNFLEDHEVDHQTAFDWPVFIISLRDAVQRRSALLAALESRGYTPIIVDAVDGRNGLTAELEAMVDRNAATRRVGRPLSDTEIACGLSHRRIYQTILDEGLSGAVVLEDDAIPTELFWNFIREQGYFEADLVQMDHMDARVKRWGRRHWKNSISLLLLAENASLTTGYSLSARAANYILENSTPLGGLADWPCDLLTLRPIVTHPQLIRHPEPGLHNSDIEASRRALISELTQRRPRWQRFFSKGYWRRWWYKRLTKKIS